MKKTKKKTIVLPETEQRLGADDYGIELEAVSPLLESEEVRARRTFLWRYGQGGRRFYFSVDETNEAPKVKFYPSVTTVIRHTTPTPIGLMKWYGEHGNEQAEAMRDEKAHYGTVMHMLAGAFLRSGEIDLEKDVPWTVNSYYDAEQLHGKYDKESWIRELSKDMASFAQFVFDRDVEPLALEVALHSDTLRMAGTADLICKMKFDKKTVVALVDLKSGRKGFYESHVMQLAYYRRMWNETFADNDAESPLFATHVFNWSPSDWRKAPTYKLENQTDNVAIKKARVLPILYAVDGPMEPKPTVRPTGKLVVGKSPSEKETLRTITPHETALSRVTSWLGPTEDSGNTITPEGE